MALRCKKLIINEINMYWKTINLSATLQGLFLGKRHFVATFLTPLFFVLVKETMVLQPEGGSLKGFWKYVGAALWKWPMTQFSGPENFSATIVICFILSLFWAATKTKKWRHVEYSVLNQCISERPLGVIKLKIFSK